ncbi:hypothetical protein CRG98_031320 [Punica granatum]|uniref:Uncharacterized protein n=1 Tax=Punica granatum TaxID=22663 RepID=A0A2I0IX99_PUNGR|nr:hypothetical protein CRG98_031320 [Punica granatum]
MGGGGTKPCVPYSDFSENIFDYEWGGCLMSGLVLPYGANTNVNARSQARPVVGERIGLHVRGLDSVECELLVIKHLPTIVGGMAGCALIVLTAPTLIMNVGVEIRARRYRSNPVAFEELSVYVGERGRQGCELFTPQRGALLVLQGRSRYTG